MLIPAILGVLDDKVYRVIVRTHHVDVHAQLSSHFAQRRWLVASDVPRQANPECVWKYVRGNYKEASPHRFNWAQLLREGCYVNTSRGPVAQSDGEIRTDCKRNRCTLLVERTFEADVEMGGYLARVDADRLAHKTTYWGDAE